MCLLQNGNTLHWLEMNVATTISDGSFIWYNHADSLPSTFSYFLPHFSHFFYLNITTSFTLFLQTYICLFANGNTLYRLKCRNYYFRWHLIQSCRSMSCPFLIFSYAFPIIFNRNITTYFTLFVVVYVCLFEYRNIQIQIEKLTSQLLF